MSAAVNPRVGPSKVHCLLQADMFSFGVVLWTLCTQEVPLRGHLRRLQAGVPGILPFSTCSGEYLVQCMDNNSPLLKNLVLLHACA